MNSKNKGNTYERKISKILSERFEAKTGLKTAFRRNADSGSFFGGKNVNRIITYDTSKATFGDIITPDDFAFSVECKHYKSPPSFAMLVKQEVKDWDKWIAQATQDCLSANKKMALIIKYNNVEEFVILEEHYGLPVIINYKGNFVIRLSDFLSLDDSVFFV